MASGRSAIAQPMTCPLAVKRFASFRSLPARRFRRDARKMSAMLSVLMRFTSRKQQYLPLANLTPLQQLEQGSSIISYHKPTFTSPTTVINTSYQSTNTYKATPSEIPS